MTTYSMLHTTGCFHLLSTVHISQPYTTHFCDIFIFISSMFIHLFYAQIENAHKNKWTITQPVSCRWLALTAVSLVFGGFFPTYFNKQLEPDSTASWDIDAHKPLPVRRHSEHRKLHLIWSVSVKISTLDIQFRFTDNRQDHSNTQTHTTTADCVWRPVCTCCGNLTGEQRPRTQTYTQTHTH